MTAEQLRSNRSIASEIRNSILQEAISGRLVPQDPNDEPASALLACIREEKARLVKEGKLKKKDLIEAPIVEDEIPFEAPNGWLWCKIKDIAFVTKLAGFEYTKYIADNLVPNGVPLFKGKNVQNGKIVYKFEAYIPESVSDSLERSQITKKCLLTPYVGTIGNIGIHNREGKFHLGSNVGKIEILNADNNIFLLEEFVHYYLLSSFGYSELTKYKKATAQESISIEAIREVYLPLPPLDEQKRIVAKLEELLPIVEQYGKAQKELDELNAALPARLRQSILQEAISGRLVPQDENETADGLKEHLLQAVNNSPFKKKWNSELIEDEELPFDIPDNWRWIRLGDIVYTQTGLSYSKGDLEKKVSNPIRVLRGGNIQSGSWCTKDDDVMIAPEFVKKDIFLKKNSFITPAVTSLEHLGKTALIREDHNDIVAGGFVLYLIPYDDKNDVLMEYLAYFFQSAFYNSFCKTITNKSGQAFWNISREKLLKLTIPLPPLAEQQRIVAKIEELFTQIDKITK